MHSIIQVRGHTFLENDCDFNQIEKRKKSVQVLLPEDWCKIVRETNLRKPIKVCKYLVKVRPCQ